MFKNSLKLFCANFDKMWKLFLYTIIVCGISFALLLPFFSEIKEAINVSWTSELLSKVPSTGLLYGSDVAGIFNAIWDFVASIVSYIYFKNVWILIYVAFICCIVLPFLLNIGKYTVNEMLYGYMSSQAKVGFCSSMIRTIRKSSVFAIFRAILSLFWGAVVVASIYGITAINAPLFAYFLPIVVIVGLSFVISVGQSFVSGWAPASVVYGFNIFKSYFMGLRAVIRRYWKILSTGFVINMIFIFLIMGFGLVSSVVFIPLYMGLINMFEMVMFFGSQGMRYYVDADTFLTPKKLEQTDNIKKTKYLL